MWKGLVRSVVVDMRRAQREQEQAQRREIREVQQEHRRLVRSHEQLQKKIERCTTELLRKAESFDAQLQRDPIKAIGVEYVENQGFQSDPIEFNSELLSFSITAVQTTAYERPCFEPRCQKSDQFAVTPLDFLFSQWGTILAVRVDNFDPEYRIRLNWVKKTDLSASSVFLVDEEHGQYYFPLSTNLTGEVLPGFPRIDLIAFERCRLPASCFQLHFSEVKLANERGRKETFHFRFSDSKLIEHIRQLGERPNLWDQVEALLKDELAEIQDLEVPELPVHYVDEPQQRGQPSGCLVSLLLMMGFLAFCFGMAFFIP